MTSSGNLKIHDLKVLFDGGEVRLYTGATIALMETDSEELTEFLKDLVNAKSMTAEVHHQPEISTEPSITNITLVGRSILYEMSDGQCYSFRCRREFGAFVMAAWEVSKKLRGHETPEPGDIIQSRTVRLTSYEFLNGLRRGGFIWQGASIDQTVRVVAVNQDGEWTAYYSLPDMPTGLKSDEERDSYVADYGTKLPEETARQIFPNILTELVYRA